MTNGPAAPLLLPPPILKDETGQTGRPNTTEAPAASSRRTERQDVRCCSARLRFDFPPLQETKEQQQQRTTEEEGSVGTSTRAPPAGEGAGDTGGCEQARGGPEQKIKARQTALMLSLLQRTRLTSWPVAMELFDDAARGAAHLELLSPVSCWCRKTQRVPQTVVQQALRRGAGTPA